MIKAIVLLSKLAHVSREQFADYYERHHAPFIQTVLPGIRAYRRNHVQGVSLNAQDTGSEAPFDAVTELMFDDEAAYERFVRATRNPVINKAVRADESHFLDFTKSKLFRVRPDVSPIRMAPDDLKNSVKVVILLSKLAHVTREGFADYYDNYHAPFMAQLLPQIRVYRRNHVIGGSNSLQSLGQDLPFDTLTELRFRDEDAYQAFIARINDPQIIKQIRGDEANFLDPLKSRLFRVTEGVSSIY